MMLVDKDIRHAMLNGWIKVDPFDEKCLGTNSYDVHLAPMLRVYEQQFERASDPPGMKTVGGRWVVSPLDVRKPPKTIDIKIPDEGYVLEPGRLYLASTIEYTETLRYVPMLNGKSSIGRYGLSVHVTAGTGDVGFCGHWTMELFVVGDPLRIYAGMAIAQLLYVGVTGDPDVPYSKKPNAKYNNRDPQPQASQAWRNFEEK